MHGDSAVTSNEGGTESQDHSSGMVCIDSAVLEVHLLLYSYYCSG